MTPAYGYGAGYGRRRQGGAIAGFSGTFTDDLTGTIALTSTVAAKQVFQLSGLGIVFSGTYSFGGSDPGGIAYRVGNSAWRQLSSETIGGGSWSGTARFTGGVGQGNLEFKPIDGLNVVAASVADITATDIFVVNGQSNADGGATNLQTYVKANYDWMVSKNGGAWAVLTIDPWSNDNGSLFPALAELYDAASVPPAFMSGTTLPATGFITNNWNPGDPAYNTTVSRMSTALPLSGGCAAHIWIQAEADANNGQTQAGYVSAFTAMLDAFHTNITNFPSSVPTFVTMLGERSGANAYDEVRLALQQLWDTDARVFPGPNLIAENFGDGAHYGIVGGGLDTAAAEAQLDRIAAMHKRCLDAVLAGGADAGRGPKVLSYTIGTAANANKITVDFERNVKNHADTTGWLVKDTEGTRTVSSSAQGTDAAKDVLTCDQALFGPTTISFGEEETGIGATLADIGANVDLPPDYVFEVSAGTGPGEVPVNTVTPAVTGSPTIGVAYPCTDGTYTGVPTPTVGSFQWQISDDGATGWTDISGATAATYTPIAGDDTKFIRRGEIATNAVGSSPRIYSNASLAISTFGDPSDIASIYEWWNASDESSITIDTGDDADTIASQLTPPGVTLDRDGGSAFAPQSGTRTVNSLNVLDFDGVNDRMREMAANTSLPQFSIRAENATTFHGGMFAQDSSFTAFSASAVDRSGLHLWEAAFDSVANTATLYFDGVQIGQATDYTGTQDGHVFMCVEIDGSGHANDSIFTNDATDGLTWMKWNGLQYGEGGGCEGAISSAVLSGDDLSNIRSYFNRWGLSL